MDALQLKGVHQKKIANKVLSAQILIPVLAGVASAVVGMLMAESLLCCEPVAKVSIERVDTLASPVMTTLTYRVTSFVFLLELWPAVGIAYTATGLGYSILNIFTQNVSSSVALAALFATNSVSGMDYVLGRISEGVLWASIGVIGRISGLRSKISSIMGWSSKKPKQAKTVNRFTGMKQPSIEPEVILLINELSERWRDMPGTVFLLDETQVRAPALPTALVTRHLNEEENITDMEYAVSKKRSINLIVNYVQGGPHLLVLTCGMYLRKHRNTIGVEKDYRPLRRLCEIIDRSDPKNLRILTHPKIFETFPENVKTRVRKVKVRLDTEAASQEIKEKLPRAPTLEVAQALIPGLADKILEGKDKLTEFLMDILGQSQDNAALIAETVYACATGQPIPKEIPRALVLALGIKIK